MALALLCAPLLCTPAHAEPDLLPYLVQAACLDPSGQVRPGLTPTDPGCDRRRPLSDGEPLPYRKHDWPSVQAAAQQPRGWAASDSLLGRLLGRPAILQSWDFGDMPGRAFGRFDAGQGDGAQALLLGADGSVGAALTEDGGAGVQWLPSPACATSGGVPTAGWLFARPPVLPDWRDTIAEVVRRPRPAECAERYTATFTRWRLAAFDLPMREAGRPGIRPVPADLLVSEHYSHDSIARSTSMERFFFARDLGWVRWEAWQELKATPQFADRAAQLAAQRRCPPLPFSDPPGPGWGMIGCRMFTNLVRATGPDAMLHAAPWPSAAGR